MALSVDDIINKIADDITRYEETLKYPHITKHGKLAVNSKILALQKLQVYIYDQKINDMREHKE